MMERASEAAPWSVCVCPCSTCPPRPSSRLFTVYPERVPPNEKALEIRVLCSLLAGSARYRRDTHQPCLTCHQPASICPSLLRPIRCREEYFCQLQTRENETIFRDYVGGQ